MMKTNYEEVEAFGAGGDDMHCTDLRKLTGKMVKEWYAWLREEENGCCSIWFASTDKYRYYVCMGWHDFRDSQMALPCVHGTWSLCRPYCEDGFRIAWKIGRQPHNIAIMLSDLDVDFKMPYDPETGDEDDTLEEVECDWKIVHQNAWRCSTPKGYRDWNALAARMRKIARRVYRDWKDHDD